MAIKINERTCLGELRVYVSTVTFRFYSFELAHYYIKQVHLLKAYLYLHRHGEIA